MIFLINFSFSQSNTDADRNNYFRLERASENSENSKTRFEIGINLKGQEPSGKLLLSGNAMCTHKMNLTAIEEIDQEVIDRLRKAYENAG